MMKIKVGDYVRCDTTAFGKEYGIVVGITKAGTYSVKTLVSRCTSYIDSVWWYTSEEVSKVNKDEIRLALL